MVEWYKDAGGLEYGLDIFSQCCHSGMWCRCAEANDGVFRQVWASAMPHEESTGGKHGSEFTKYMFDTSPSFVDKSYHPPPKDSTGLCYYYENTGRDAVSLD